MSYDWLKSRWTIGGGACVAIALVLWFVGDTLALGEWRPLDTPVERLAAILVVVAGWLGWEFWRTHAARRENARLLEGIAGAGAEGESAERAAREIAILRQRFEEAMAVLKKARFRGPDGERRFVHELPWYVFIGAPGSGKTTALLNAGLHFPIGKQGEHALGGIGGTRNCDWWFAEEAVLLDTAGRYTTQESDRQADAAAWTGFLALLKRFRPRQPLNGAIVTLSVSDLLQWSAAERARYGEHVKARVDELYARLGVRFPVYLLVTKCDLLAGFMEFFGEFDPEARAQVWGTTFDPIANPGVYEAYAFRFEGDFAAIEARLNGRLLARLQEERDLQKRAAIYRFPQQFRTVGPLIGEFLDAALSSGADGAAPLLRGVYFTSGTQEGSPIDRILGTLARSFNLESAVAAPLVGSGKSFFLKRLLGEVVFGEYGLAGSDARVERRARIARLAAYGAIGAVSALLLAAWSMSFLGNRDFIASAQAKSVQAKSQLAALTTLRPGEETKLIELLNALRDLPGGYGERGSSKPWSLGWGLYQGDKLGAQAVRAYRSALRDALLVHLALSLENAIRSVKTSEALAETLNAYLMLYDPKQLDPKLVEAIALRLWQLPEQAKQDLAGHLRAGLEVRPLDLPRARDDTVVQDARRRLDAAKRT